MEAQPILESWKEISAYLKRSVRTCRRWESSLGLPVHRLDGTPSARVFAYPEEIDRWMAEKLHKNELESKAPGGSHRLRKILLLASAAVVIILAASVIFARLVFPPALLPIPSDKPSLAIVQFENSTGDDRLEPWRTAFPDLMITDLVQSRFVTVVRITDLYRLLNKLNLGEVKNFSPADLNNIADRAKVGVVATGSLGKAGQDMTITVLLQNPKTGEAIKSISANWRKEKDVFPLVDDLTKRIKLALQLTPRYVSRDIDEDVSQISTRSPQAFKLYSQGYRLAGIEKYQEGISLLQKAVEIDPKFALAYKYLYRACQNTRREEDEKKYIQKAVDLSHRLSERERDELEYSYYGGYQENLARQNGAIERLYRFYPDDRLAVANLLSVYTCQEEWDKALPVALDGYATNKANATLCAQLATCFANVGQGDRALEILDEFITANPDNPYLSQVLWARYKCYMWQNKFDLAMEHIDREIVQYPGIMNRVQNKGLIYMRQNDFSAAEREFRRSFEQGSYKDKYSALMWLSKLYLARGKIAQAKSQLRSGLELAEGIKIDGHDADHDEETYLFQSDLHFDLTYLLWLSGELPEALKEMERASEDYRKWPSYSGPSLDGLRWRALILLKMNKMDEFEKQIEEIKQIIEKGQRPKLMRDYYYLLGHREFQRKNFKGAIDYFWKAVDLLSVPGQDINGTEAYYFYSLAEAYNQYEYPEGSTSVLPIYEKVTLPAVNWISYGDMYARSFLKMAKIYDSEAASRETPSDQAKVNKIKAIENYRKFLSLWGNADSIFAAEVTDAKERLASLESE